jgi:histidyl-tRNA synthetase
MPLGEENKIHGLILADQARMLGFTADMCFDDTKFGNMFKRAEKKGAKLAVIIGDNEVKEGKVIIKNLETKEQYEIPASLYEEELMKLLGKEEDKECCCGGNHERECCEGDESECCCRNREKE